MEAAARARGEGPPRSKGIARGESTQGGRRDAANFRSIVMEAAARARGEGPPRSKGVGRRRGEQGPQAGRGEATPEAEKPATARRIVERERYGAGREASRRSGPRRVRE